MEKDVSNHYDAQTQSQTEFIEEWTAKVFPEDLTPELIKEYKAIEEAAAGASSSATAEQV